MPLIAKICAVIMLMMLVRCPSVAQQMCARMAALSTNCTEGNSLIKSVNRSRIIREHKQSFISLGLQYNRATTFTDPTALTIEKQYRVGVPLLAGLRKGRCTLEAGGFFGVNMNRPQQSFWFANPETGGSRSVSPTAAPMLNIGMDVASAGQLSLRYLHLDDLPDSNVLSKVQLGWSWNW